MTWNRNGGSMEDKETMLTTAQAAKIAGKHPRTVVSWIHKGLLTAAKYPGGRGAYLIRKKDLDKLVAYLYTPQPYEPTEQDRREETHVVKS